MKKKKILSALLLLTAALALCLTGCGSSEPELPPDAPAVGLVIVAGRHSNANLYTDSMLQEAEPLVQSAFRCRYDSDREKYYAEADIAVIVSDGTPTAEPLTCRLSANTLQNLNYQIEQETAALLAYLTGDALRATEEEVDLLAAVAEADTLLRGGDYDERHILILDTGVTTAGYFNMNAINILDGSVEDVLGRINPAAFPDLSGDTITFLNLGNVSGAQTDWRKNNVYKQRLPDVWTALLTDRCHAALSSPIQFSASAGDAMLYYEDGGTDADPGYPYVSQVVFPLPAEPTSAPAPYVLNTAEIGFLADSADFRDDAHAGAVLQAAAQSLADYLADHPDDVIYVVGSIAKVSPDAEQATSRVSAARAERVAALLCSEYGIPSDRLVVIDGGTTPFSWRSSAEFAADGTVDPQAQQRNRVVAIIPQACEEAAELQPHLG